MICPQCRRPFYFLKSRVPAEGARCLKCGHQGAPAPVSYETYHASNYLTQAYRRTAETDPQMKWILGALAVNSGEVVIDLGCGVGDYTQALRLQTGRVAGYDRDVSAAREKYAGVSFFEHDFGKPVPLPDASVDKIVSINTIEHLADWQFFLEECRRILRPGGLIALSTANRDFFLHNLHFDVTHMHEWTLAEFTQIVEPYFQTLTARKDCAMFKYYPWNLFFSRFLKPDLTWIGRKPD